MEKEEEERKEITSTPKEERKTEDVLFIGTTAFHRSHGNDPIIFTDKDEITHVYSDIDYAVNTVAKEHNIPFISVKGTNQEIDTEKLVEILKREEDDRIEMAAKFLSKEETGKLRAYMDNKSDIDSDTEMYAMFKEGNVKKLEEKMKTDQNYHTRPNSLSHHPIHIACRYGNQNMVIYLLETLNVDATVKGLGGKTVMHYTCLGSNLETLKYLLENGFDPDVKDDNGNTPITMLETLIHTYEDNHLLLRDPIVNSIYERLRDMDDTIEIMLKKRKRKRDEDFCMVCLDEIPDTVAFPCGHSVVCKKCSKKLEKDIVNSKHCLKCMQPIKEIRFD